MTGRGGGERSAGDERGRPSGRGERAASRTDPLESNPADPRGRGRAGADGRPAERAGGSTATDAFAELRTREPPSDPGALLEESPDEIIEGADDPDDEGERDDDLLEDGLEELLLTGRTEADGFLWVETPDPDGAPPSVTDGSVSADASGDDPAADEANDDSTSTGDDSTTRNGSRDGSPEDDPLEGIVIETGEADERDGGDERDRSDGVDRNGDRADEGDDRSVDREGGDAVAPRDGGDAEADGTTADAENGESTGDAESRGSIDDAESDETTADAEDDEDDDPSRPLGVLSRVRSILETGSGE